MAPAWLRAALALAASAPLLLPQPPTTLRTETRVVQIDVEATDSHGQPVAGLTKDDFTLLDAGKRRRIQIFSVAAAGAAREAPPPARAPSYVFSNQSPAARRPTHVTVILLDAINNYWDDLASARLRLIAMVDKLRQDEPVAVYAATTRPAGIAVIQDLTTDRARILRSVQAYHPPPIDPAPGLGPKTPPAPAEEDLRRRVAVLDTMSAFRLLSEHLGKLPGRKSLLWVTSGLPPRQLRELPDPLEKATAALNEANVAVNVMDDDGVGGPHRRWGHEAGFTLPVLAESTGGKTYQGRNDLDNALLEAIETPRITYTLGFYLPDEERDDRFHPLTVRVNRAKVTLAYRKGYYAGVPPPPTAPRKREPLENALLDPRDSDEIAISAEIARTPATPRDLLHISLRLGLSRLSLRQQGGEWSGAIEELLLETNAAGQVVARLENSKTFHGNGRTREQFESEGLPVTEEFGLMPEAARLLIVVRDQESGRTGSLSVPVQDLPPR